MTIDPQAQAILAMFAGMPAPDFAKLTGAQYRAGVAGMQLPSHNEPVARIADHVLPGPGGDLAVRLYHPLPDARVPAIVFFHGGGWVSCGLDSHDNLCRRLANLSGCAVVAVDYRLAPEAPFPAPLDDACAALRWVHGHAALLDIDPDRLAVAGDSAGGNLAAACALLAWDAAAALPRLSHQLLLYPVLDDACDSASFATYADGYLLTAAMMRWFWQQYAPADAQRRDPRAAPARATALAGLPGATIITAQCDPLHDEAGAYAARLRQADVPVQLTCFDGMFHGFASMTGMLDAADAAVALAAMSVRAALVR
ncbi:MAG: alpha/beta hydrolase [Pseudomonadota bacterium]|nr:alpha/beta hydrolase [Pseudomonadota bacterium]